MAGKGERALLSLLRGLEGRKGYMGFLLLFLLFALLLSLPTPHSHHLTTLRVEKSFYDVLHYNEMAVERGLLGALMAVAFLSQLPPEVLWGPSAEGPALLASPFVVEALEAVMERASDAGVGSLYATPLYDARLSPVGEGNMLAACGSPSPLQLHQDLIATHRDGRPALSLPWQEPCHLSRVRLSLPPSIPREARLWQALEGSRLELSLGPSPTVVYAVAYKNVSRTAILPPVEVSITLSPDAALLPLAFPPYMEALEEELSTFSFAPHYPTGED